MKWNEFTLNSLCVSLNVLREQDRYRWDVAHQSGIQRAPLTGIDTLLLEGADFPPESPCPAELQVTKLSNIFPGNCCQPGSGRFFCIMLLVLSFAYQEIYFF